MNRLAPDIRCALRTLGRERTFSLVVALTLALGLGVNATVFGMVDAMLLRPFPFADYRRLVVLWESRWESSDLEPVAPANFLDWREQARSYERLVAWEWWDATLTGREEPERIYGFHVSPGFFELLGVEPTVGRTFASDEGRMGNHRQVVLGDGIWKRRFGGDPRMVGRKILFGREPYTVVGIAPPRFEFPVGAEVWSPLVLTPDREADRANRTLVVAGKLAAGRTLAAAQEEMDVISRGLEGRFPETNRDRRAMLRTLSDAFREGSAGPLFVTLQGVAGIVLLAACANIAGLVLARGVDRRRELALRTALGASRARILRQIVLESTVLGLAGSLAALLMASLALEILRTSMPAEMARHVEGWGNLRMNGRLMVLTPVVAIGVGLAVGFIAAIGASRNGLSEAFKGRSTFGSVQQQRGRKLLVVAEIAIALSLLIAAGLAVEGSRRIANQPGGFASEDLLTLQIPLPEGKYRDASSRRGFAEEFLTGLANVPSVESAALASILPAAGFSPSTAFLIEGEPPPEPARRPRTGIRVVSPGFFETLRIPLLRGRFFSNRDREDSQPVAVVSASMAERFWPGEEPIGRRLRFEEPQSEWATIVGVAGDVRMFNWWDGEDAAAVYVPWRQEPPGGTVHLAVRTGLGSKESAASVREVLRPIDPLLALDRVRTMEEAIAEGNVGLHYLGSMMGICGAVALVLSIAGTYSLMAYTISQRTHELGVRMALGATAADLLRTILGQAALWTAAGVTSGLALALLLGQLMESSVLGILAFDRNAFAFASLGSILSSLVAAFVPARRVLRLDPVPILRSE
jgi:putative ABC transport system permease protein